MKRRKEMKKERETKEMRMNEKKEGDEEGEEIK